MSILSRFLKRGPGEGQPAGDAPGGAAIVNREAFTALDTPTPTQPEAPRPTPPVSGAASAPVTEPRPEPRPAPRIAQPTRAPDVIRPAVTAAKPAPAPAPAPEMAAVPAVPRAAAPLAANRRPTAAPDAAKARRGARGSAAEALLPAASVEQAVEKTFSPAAGAVSPAGDVASTVIDRAALLATFEDLAVPHAAPVRGFMLEVRWGEAQTIWIELARPPLRSLRAMADQIGHAAFTAALDGFDAALEKALQPGAPSTVAGAMREALLSGYAPLGACLPRAFDLDGERDRREPLVVRALLEQVPGLDALMRERMAAAGVAGLETLVRAKADELAAVAGMTVEIAAAVVERVQAFRRAAPAALATLDPAATARELRELVLALQAQHRTFEDAARGWSDASRVAKRQLRAQRQISFLQVLIALARLGEIDFALRLEKLAFARRIDELERFMSRNPPAASAPGVAAVTATATATATTANDGGLQPGARGAAIEATTGGTTTWPS